MSENSEVHEFTVGLFGIGLDTYWPQFAGLQERLTGYTQQVADRLEETGVRVINLGLVDSPQKAEAAGHSFRRHDVDLIFLYVTTYALSSTRSEEHTSELQSQSNLVCRLLLEKK